MSTQSNKQSWKDVETGCRWSWKRAKRLWNYWKTTLSILYVSAVTRRLAGVRNAIET